MLCFGPTSSIFDYAMFGVMWFVFGANNIAHQSLFQTGWFVEGLLSQTLIIHLIRTSKIPFFQSWAAPPLTFLTLLIMAIGIYIPFCPLAHVVGFVPLPMQYFPWLVGILLGYCVLTQCVKQWFIRRFGYHS
jgi:Mg2+-importing ATPase